MATTFDEHERQRWAGRAPAYQRSFAALCAYVAPALLDAAGVGADGAGGRLLDVGTGPGTVAALARARGADVAAVDAEPSMVALARTNAPDVDVRHSVLPDLPFPDGSFDAVVANFVLNHVGDPGATMAALRLVTAPGGRIAITVWPHPPPPLQQLWQDVMAAAGLPPPAIPRVSPQLDFARTAAGLTGLLAGAGLTSVSCRQVSWRYATDPQVLWDGAASGIGALGVAMSGLPTDRVAEVRQHHDRLAAEYLTPDGFLAIPTTALLAAATR